MTRMITERSMSSARSFMMLLKWGELMSCLTSATDAMPPASPPMK